MFNKLVKRISIMTVFCMLLPLLFTNPAFAQGQFAGWETAATWKCIENTENGQLFSVAYGNKIFVAVGKNIIKTSTDGLTWTKVKLNLASTLQSVKWFNDRFFAVGFNGVILTSLDGTKWTQATINTAMNIIDIAYSGKQYVAVGASGTTFVSTDGVKWSINPGITRYFLGSVVWAKNQFVTMDCFGKVFTSPNGIKWSEKPTISGMEDGRLRYINEKIYALGKGTYLTSSDVIDWEINNNLNLDYSINSIIRLKNSYICAGYNGVLSVSSDESNWIKVPTGNENCFQDLAVGNGIVVAVGFRYEGELSKSVIWVGTNKYNNTSVKSSKYTINQAEETISNIPYGTSIAEFTSNLELAEGASINFYQKNNEIASGILTKNMSMVVYAADGATSQDYKLLINKNTDAALESTKYKIDEYELTIANVSSGTFLKDFINNLKISDGATYTAKNTIKLKDYPEMIGPETLLEITAEDGIVKKEYTILVDSIELTINDVIFELSNSPIILNNSSIIVPINELSEKLGLGYKYNEKKKEISLTRGKTTVIFTIDSKAVKINGKKAVSPVSPKFIKVPYLPLQYVCEKFGLKYTYDAGNTKLKIVSPYIITLKTDNISININNFSIETNKDGLYDDRYVKKFILLNIDIINNSTEPVKYCANDFILVQKISASASKYAGETRKILSEIGVLSDDYYSRLIQQPTISETVYNTLGSYEKQQGNLPFELYEGAYAASLQLIYKNRLVIDLNEQ